MMKLNFLFLTLLSFLLFSCNVEEADKETSNNLPLVADGGVMNGPNGWVTFAESVSTTELSNDGAIFLANRFSLWKVYPNGQAVSSFANMGRLDLGSDGNLGGKKTLIRRILPLDDGKIAVVGKYEDTTLGSSRSIGVRLYLLNSNGSVNSDFGTDGFLHIDMDYATNIPYQDVSGVEQLKDKSFIISVHRDMDLRIYHISATGDLLNSFEPQSDAVSLSGIYALSYKMQKDALGNCYLLAAYTNSSTLPDSNSFKNYYYVVFKIKADGTQDMNYGSGGFFRESGTIGSLYPSNTGIGSIPQDFAVNYDGSLIIFAKKSANQNQQIVVKVTPSGMLDRNFNRSGIRSLDITKNKFTSIYYTDGDKFAFTGGRFEPSSNTLQPAIFTYSGDGVPLSYYQSKTAQLGGILNHYRANSRHQYWIAENIFADGKSGDKTSLKEF